MRDDEGFEEVEVSDAAMLVMHFLRPERSVAGLCFLLPEAPLALLC